MRGQSAGAALFICLLVGACEDQQDLGLAHVELVIDAFYSFDPVPLRASLEGVDGAGAIMYYQAWAEAANYAIQTRRPCSRADATSIVCAITVTDDFGQTMGYMATDTFTLTMQDNRISAIAFAGDDPPIFDALLGWMAANQPQVMNGPCKDSFTGGSTPAQCARAVVAAAKVFVSLDEASRGVMPTAPQP